MKEIETILEPITGYLVSITRNPMKGWYEMEVGVPINWVFNENNEIDVEVVQETETGRLLKIIPKNQNVAVDDLVLFVRIVISTNKKIADKELEFKAEMEAMKKGLERKASDFFKELDELKENSFKKLNDNFVEGLDETKKERKKRTPKVPTTSGDTSSNRSMYGSKLEDLPE